MPGFVADRSAWSGLALVFKLALREMRGGLRGFGIFLACVALGVAAIAAVGSVGRSLTDGLAAQGRLILGGDLSYSLVQREATEAEQAFLAARGDLSSVATLRAMVVAGEKGSALVEVKAIDDRYPSLGTLETDPLLARDALGATDGAYGAFADPVLLARLGLKAGDRVSLGHLPVILKAAIVTEPDKVVAGVGFGPRLMISQEALKASGLLQPGSLVRWTYRLVLPPGADGDAALASVQTTVKQAFPEAGWEMRSRLEAAPRLAREIERFTQFLTLVGLTALLVGGVGVANAVNAFVDRKRPSIATLKSIGAPGGQVVAIYLLQVMLMALIGVAIGMALGATVPFLLSTVGRTLIPLPLEPSFAPLELALAALYGLLTAFVFALLPLGRAHDVPVTALFRAAVQLDRRMPRRRYLVALGIAIAALVTVAVVFSYDRWLALIFVAAAAAVFLLLRLVASGLMRLARALPRVQRPAVRLAIANIHRPAAPTPSLVLSLGLGITLIVTLALIETNLRNQLTGSLPAEAPSFFFLDVPGSQAEDFRAFLAKEAPGAKIEQVPMMRGRLLTLKGEPAESYQAPEDVQWVLDGDRGITYSATVPENSKVVAGAWWPADYAGPPLVSFESEIAEKLRLGIGDVITVNVLGRRIEARIANLRKLEWRSLGINFVMVFTPNTFAGAPHTDLATLSWPRGQIADNALITREAALLRAAAETFPVVTSVRVRDALQAVDDMVSQLALAVRAAASIALAASILVLAGAMAASHQARLYDAVVLKTIGATRAHLLTAYIIEYGVIALATAVFGFMAGSMAGWLIITRVMRLSFDLSPMSTILAALVAVVVAVGIGLAGTWRILGQKPAPYLRDL
ncbi:ABC transporter permease [Chelatococcus asaccharovorans]|uniref:Putative ABC transport system permease protein n=1 Tax=Chelatococcus asaccharovorans TaxID=28210 RepID=A0A2V3U8T5_9HYPH|nr:FtsX-like permease family protein [Chelatococcus asaccharovorans]PXW58734.1 putative ABC transport system permease protein [Chelatococcus asaccharovorans]